MTLNAEGSANTMSASASFEREETVRVEAFSDGVFAPAITLLVLGSRFGFEGRRTIRAVRKG